MNNYREYISKKGAAISKDIKNNIYADIDNQTRLLLIAYILDTMENYDSRNCPDYEEVTSQIITEDSEYLVSTEDFQFIITTENLALDVFTKIGLNAILRNLTKDISCQ